MDHPLPIWLQRHRCCISCKSLRSVYLQMSPNLTTHGSSINRNWRLLNLSDRRDVMRNSLESFGDVSEGLVYPTDIISCRLIGVNHRIARIYKFPRRHSQLIPRCCKSPTSLQYSTSKSHNFAMSPINLFPFARNIWEKSHFVGVDARFQKYQTIDLFSTICSVC